MVLNNFYQTVMKMTDTELIALCKNQNGNYVIQSVVSKLHRDKSLEYFKYLVNRIANFTIELSIHRFGCRVIQTCLGLADLDEQLHITSHLIEDLPEHIYHNNAGHVIQKVIFTNGKNEENEIINTIL